MNSIRVPVIQLYANNIHTKKESTKPNYAANVAPKANLNPNLPRLAMPGFNDHHVILFGKKPAAKYEPVDAVEKNSMDIYKNIAPSVVKINVKIVQVTTDPKTGKSTKQESGGSGSGSIIDKQGHILTNFHVINNASKITVVLDKDREVTATLVGKDPSSDLALIKLDLPEEELAKLPVMKFGQSSEVKGGQRAFAVGNPFSLFRTMTQGIVSALDRNIISPGGRMTKGVIQTDASINPGNSGGALLNARGEQIGVNSQIYTPSGGSIGLGFAIPIDTAKEVVHSLKTKGRVIRPYLGVNGGVPLEMFPPQILAMLGIPKLKQGVILQSIIPDSPAEKAGLKGSELMVQFAPQAPPIGLGGDVITKVDGKPVGNMTEIFEIIDEKGIGENLEIEYINLDVEPTPGGAIKGFPSEPKTLVMQIGETPPPEKPANLDGPNPFMPKPLEDKNFDDFRFKS